MGEKTGNQYNGYTEKGGKNGGGKREKSGQDARMGVQQGGVGCRDMGRCVIGKETGEMNKWLKGKWREE